MGRTHYPLGDPRNDMQEHGEALGDIQREVSAMRDAQMARDHLMLAMAGAIEVLIAERVERAREKGRYVHADVNVSLEHLRTKQLELRMEIEKETT